jgi:predicted amidohydrolase
MKICVAQTRPVKGDVQSNIDNHKKLINLAVSSEVDIIVFPELSLTGYEPTLSNDLAINPEDSRLDDFQNISTTNRIAIGVGIPTKTDLGTCISLILFRPDQGRKTYSKKYLHPDEEEYFVSGQNFSVVKINEINIAFAICYELSIPEHCEVAVDNGACIYIASVAKFMNGIDSAMARLSHIANTYSMTVLMSNCVGQSDGNVCAGKTSIWNSAGVLVDQLNDVDEGILVIDTETQQLISKSIIENPFLNGK